MVASGRVRVLFKPHPALGDRREDVLAALAGIEALVADAPHARVPDGPEALYAAMNEADLLISDVSSVLSDWLACGRPYLVTNPQRLPAEELHSRFPTTRGGAVLAPGEDVLRLVDVAVGADPMAATREELSRYLLGPHRQDPMQDFVDEVAAFVARAPLPAQQTGWRRRDEAGAAGGRRGDALPAARAPAGPWGTSPRPPWSPRRSRWPSCSSRCSGPGWPSSWTACSWDPPCGCWPATGCCSCWSSGSAGRRRTWPARAWRRSPPYTWPGRACWPGSATVLARTVWPLAWRHLRVPGLRVPAERRVSRLARRASTLLAEVLDLPVAAGLLLVAAGATGRWLLAGLGVCAVLALAAGIPLAARVRALPARSRDDIVAAVRAAVVDLAPRVVICFGGPPSSTHALNVSVPVLERLDVPVLALVRQRVHLDQLDSTRLPAAWLPPPGDVEALAVPSVALAMYPTNITQNNHLIRVPGITDVFVGHGDSDKGGSFTPLSRIYDEVWVAGPAGRDRYRLADVGVRDEQVREVGRPQLAEITRAADGRPATPGLFTVLYAPTWEGFYAEYSYSSLQVMGERLVRGLLALDGVRVLVKPHPASGSVDPAFATAARAVTDLVRRAGGPHQVVSGVTGLYEAFNEADMLVTDVSSVVTDFLASHKPYVMTNPHALPEADYRREFPSSGGAALWTPDLGTLADDVADARGADVRRADRERVAAYLLGADEGDPVDRFAAAVTELVGR